MLPVKLYGCVMPEYCQSMSYYAIRSLPPGATSTNGSINHVRVWLPIVNEDGLTEVVAMDRDSLSPGDDS